MSLSIYAGTVGASVWSSDDGGDTWDRPFFSGLYFECRVFSLTSHPSDADTVLAATDVGVQRWRASKGRWEHVPTPMDGRTIWSIAQSPHDPGLILAGVTPAALYRSEDSGQTWAETPVLIPAECEAVDVTRVTQILFDPVDPLLVWAIVEIAGVYRSRDGGRSWEKRIEGLTTEDLHGIAVLQKDGGRKLLAATNKGLHVSTDDGDHWTFQDVPAALRTALAPPEEWQYTRCVVAKADGSGTVFLTNGDGPPGSTGRMLKSDDYGETWVAVALPVEPNSTLWCIAVNAREPETVFCCSAYGQLFRSLDGGSSWTKLKRELGEIRALLAVAG